MPKFYKKDPEGRWDSTNADEYLWWPRILWIDPGVVSGVAVLWFDPKALFGGQPIPRAILGYSELFLYGPEDGLNGQVNRFLRLRRSLDQEPGLLTGCESFVPRMMSQDEDFLAPVRIRAGIQARMSVMKPLGAEAVPEGGIPLYTQTPSDALTTYKNSRLKDLGMYTPGPDHVNDAKRHTLLRLRKIQHGTVEEFQEQFGHEDEWFE